jgi:hypothetical protein
MLSLFGASFGLNLGSIFVIFVSISVQPLTAVVAL